MYLIMVLWLQSLVVVSGVNNESEVWRYVWEVPYSIWDMDFYSIYIRNRILMKFPLAQLYKLNRSKPLVQVDDTDEWVQWDTCDLEGLPPERIGTHGGNPTMNDMGKLPKGQYENLPEVFIDTNGIEHRIEDIHCLRASE